MNLETVNPGGFLIGVGECPFVSWRTEVKVLDGNQQPVEGVTVTAQLPDGDATINQLTDVDGKATIYLPNGTTKLHSELEGREIDLTVKVKDAVATADLVLPEVEPRIFVIYDFWSSKNHIGQVVSAESRHVHDRYFPEQEFVYHELKEILTQKYDVEDFITGEDWAAAETAEQRKEKFGYLDSDIHIEINASRTDEIYSYYKGKAICAAFDFRGFSLSCTSGNTDLYDLYGIFSGMYTKSGWVSYGYEDLTDNPRFQYRDGLNMFLSLEIDDQDAELLDERKYSSFYDAVRDSDSLRKKAAEQITYFYPMIDEILDSM